MLLPAAAGRERLPESERGELLRSKSEAQAARRSSRHWLPVSQAQDAADCLPPIRAFAPDWIICDHRRLIRRGGELAAKVAGCRLMAIDDLADCPTPPIWLLDQNLDHTPADYAGLAARLPPAHRHALRLAARRIW